MSIQGPKLGLFYLCAQLLLFIVLIKALWTAFVCSFHFYALNKLLDFLEVIQND